uniref:Gsp_69 putative toxin n=1 Tax=Gemmula speciosa TaxID=439592 RepID=A0A098LXR1_GEMSP
MTCLPLFIVTIIVVSSVNVADGGPLYATCNNLMDCDPGLKCSRHQCLIPFNSDQPCSSTGSDCEHGVWCRNRGSQPGKCMDDYRCKSGKCNHPDRICDDGICGYKEGTSCLRDGPCSTGLSCQSGTCESGGYW